jgi:hypothetical protein
MMSAVWFLFSWNYICLGASIAFVEPCAQSSMIQKKLLLMFLQMLWALLQHLLISLVLWIVCAGRKSKIHFGFPTQILFAQLLIEQEAVAQFGTMEILHDGHCLPCTLILFLNRIAVHTDCTGGFHSYCIVDRKMTYFALRLKAYKSSHLHDEPSPRFQLSMQHIFSC